MFTLDNLYIQSVSHSLPFAIWMAQAAAKEKKGVQRHHSYRDSHCDVLGQFSYVNAKLVSSNRP